MNNEFIRLLRKRRDQRGRPLWTVWRIADEIYCSRPTVSDALNNNSKRGLVTRRKLVKFFQRHFPLARVDVEAHWVRVQREEPDWKQLVEALGWDETGRMAGEPMFHM